MKVLVCQLDGVMARAGLPLAAGVIVSAARADPALNARCTFDILVGRPPLDEALAACAGVDVLGLSLYQWNQQYALELARRVKRARPATLIVAGGPEVPCCPDDAARFVERHDALDVAVLGEGEDTFCEVLRSAGTPEALAGIAGVATRAGGELSANAPPPRRETFATHASPFLDGTFDALVARGHRFHMALLETNRGCPFSCVFCAWGREELRRVVDLPLERVWGELRWIADNGIPFLYIVDANFGLRRRDRQIAERIGELFVERGAPAGCHFHFTKSARREHLDIARALKAAGINSHLSLSAQDFTPSVLRAARRVNIDPAAADELRAMCHDEGIPTFNELILGLPEQTYESFAASLVAAITPYPGDSFELFLARVVENAALGTPEYREGHGIQTRRCVSIPDHLPYQPEVDEYEEIVVATHTLPMEAWRRALRFGYLTAACTSGRLLDVVLQYLVRVVRLDIQALLEHLADRLVDAAPDTVWAAMEAVFSRHTASIEASGPLFLPAPGGGASPRRVRDGVLLEALRDIDRFYAAARSLVRGILGEQAAAAEALDEAFAYQAFIMPRRGRFEPRRARFEHDWPAFQADVNAIGEGALQPHPTDLELTPPQYVAAPSLAIYFDYHLASIYSKTGEGHMRRV